MTSAVLELQGVVSRRLKADAVVSAIVAERVFDHVPRTEAGDVLVNHPYVSLGPTDETTEEADCVDGLDIAFQVDCWSRAVGYPEVRQLADAVRDALHNYELTLTDNALTYFKHRQTRVFRDSDGLTSHAVLSFEAYAEQS